MIPIRVARRYAEALLDSAGDHQCIDAVSRNLLHLRNVIRSSHDFAVFLRSPVVRREKKEMVLKELFASRIDELTLSFLFLLTSKGREETLPQVIEEFFLLRDMREGIVRVDVRSAQELSTTHVRRLEERFMDYTKSKVRLSRSLDETLIGGVVSRIGDTVFDGSVRRQLEMIRERLKGGEPVEGM